MENTGRIKHYILPEISDILYNTESEEALIRELDTTTKINKAHVLMLAECECITEGDADRLLRAIRAIESERYADVLRQPMRRGLYLAYESVVIERIGLDIGGLLQYGRSRNDLKATVLKIQLREPLIELYHRLIEFIELLLEKSSEYNRIIMPAYTHYQPAVPITYGHYLMGAAHCFSRSMEHLEVILDELGSCPLGAGAVGGTTVCIDSNRTANLLGFDAGVSNSVDAVASRDYVIRILAELTVLDCNITRICEDLLLWTSSDFKFIDMPDCMVGGSSMMPNKRNVFVLENIRGRAAASSGAFIAAANAMSGAPFSNSIAVGTEGVSCVWKPLKCCAENIFLLSCVIRHGIPNKAAMHERAAQGYTLATEQANFIVRNTTHSFRDAHQIIGDMITCSEMNNRDYAAAFSGWVRQHFGYTPPAGITEINESFLEVANYGGGPGIDSWNIQNNRMMTMVSSSKERLNARIEKYTDAEQRLDDAVARFLERSVTND